MEMYYTESEIRIMTEQTRLKIYVAAHYFVTVSPRATKIASVLGIGTPTLYRWLDTPQIREVWHEALDFWGAEHINALPKGYAQYRYERRKRERQEAADKLRQAGQLPNDLGRAAREWESMF